VSSCSPKLANSTPSRFSSSRVTERQAAILLGVSKDTLKKWRVRKRGPRYYKYHDGAIRYSLADLNQYFADHLVEN
jgi:hypothetical protein